MKKTLIILFTIMPLYAAHCVDAPATPVVDDVADVAAEQLLTDAPADTQCATGAFADALAKKLTDIPEDTPESDIETLIYGVFSSGDTLKRVVECPEIKNTDETDSIRFMPIKYTFPAGREIVVNYETQPKILTQRLALANKPSLPGGGDSPRLGDLNDPAIWTNTDPAWYGIIVTQAGTLRNFVGDGNNNTVSLRYIEDNIDTLMPHPDKCTSGSATANDHENINLAAHRTTMDTSSQDYYVSGDVNLQWISYLEIGLDVAITVATFGGGAVISGVTKSARAARTMKNLTTGIRALAKTESVKNYIQLSQKYTKLAAKVKNLKRTNVTALDKNLERATKQLAKMSPGSKSHIAQQAEVDKWQQLVKALDDLARDPSNTAAREIIEKSNSKTARQSMYQVLEDGVLKVAPKDVQEMEKIAKDIKNIEKTDKNVQQYKKAADAFSDLNKFRHSLRMTRLPAQRGNVFTRAIQRTKDVGRYVKNANTGAKKISEANDIAHETIKMANKTLKAEAQAAAKKTAAEAAAKTGSAATKATKITKAINGLKTIFGKGQRVEYARASIKGGRLRDWLFHSSMKNAAKLGRMEEAGGLLYGALKFAGDMYDWSETSTGDYTSGIQFKPLLLLSADDIEGQENVVNHGMWFLWHGDTFSAADDDAAYLQAMDFAEKFYQDLMDVQSETDNHSCDVDIYVVRPIIRNPGEQDAELYYLIMNDTPWSTNDE